MDGWGGGCGAFVERNKCQPSVTSHARRAPVCRRSSGEVLAQKQLTSFCVHECICTVTHVHSCTHAHHTHHRFCTRLQQYNPQPRLPHPQLILIDAVIIRKHLPPTTAKCVTRPWVNRHPPHLVYCNLMHTQHATMQYILYCIHTCICT